MASPGAGVGGRRLLRADAGRSTGHAGSRAPAARAGTMKMAPAFEQDNSASPCFHTERIRGAARGRRDAGSIVGSRPDPADRRRPPLLPQGLLTNDIAALTPGTGCYAAMLTAQGRMITDMRVLELGDASCSTCRAVDGDAVREHLDRFIFSEDVQVEDVTVTRAEIGVYGPGAARCAASRPASRAAPIGDAPSSAPLHGTRRRADGRRRPQRRLGRRRLRRHRRRGGRGAGERRRCSRPERVRVDADAADVVRIESGRPRVRRRHGRRHDPARSRASRIARSA